MDAPLHDRRRVRSVFLSDVHLGTRASQGERLIDFLRHHRADTLYLVGDIVDGWRLKARWCWDGVYNEIIDELISAARSGARIVYLPGNHDAFLRDFCGIEVADSAIHAGFDGRRYLVIHGDQFDRMMKLSGGMAHAGARANALLLSLSNAVEIACSRLGLPAWSLSRWAKRNVKDALNYVGSFERAVAELARAHQVDGIICGHVHHAAIHDRFGVRYINCGDWLESCTGIVERCDGGFEIVSWAVSARNSNSAVPLIQPQMA